MSFYKIGHTTGLIPKMKFYCVYGKKFFLVSHFLVVKDYKLSQGTSHLLSVALPLEYVRIRPPFFSTSIDSLIIFSVRLLSEPMILLLTQHVTKHLTCRNKLR